MPRGALKLPPTGNAGGVHNLEIDTTGKDFDTLVKEMGRGLIVTDLMGFGVNIVTGDYSRGASGFWVENGEIAHPVEEITIAGNLAEMFKHILECGPTSTGAAISSRARSCSSPMTVAGS